MYVCSLLSFEVRAVASKHSEVSTLSAERCWNSFPAGAVGTKSKAVSLLLDSSGSLKGMYDTIA